MKDFDLNGNGEFDYTEFLTATMSRTIVTDEARLQEAFKTFDANHDGFVDK